MWASFLRVKKATFKRQKSLIWYFLLNGKQVLQQYGLKEKTVKDDYQSNSFEIALHNESQKTLKNNIKLIPQKFHNATKWFFVHCFVSLLISLISQ